MVNVKNEGVVLKKRPFEFESGGVLNPGCIEHENLTHMFYRAVRDGNYSSVGYCQLNGKEIIKRLSYPIIVPEHDYEKHGVEDPRITKIGDTFYILYTAYDGLNARVALVTTKNMILFEKHGLISPQITYSEAEDIFNKTGVSERYVFFESQLKETNGEGIMLWEKDAVLFPEKINGKFAMLHRILPGIQIAYFDNFTDLDTTYWKKYLAELNKHVVLDPLYPHENRYIGSGCPPIKTKDGWLLIYHSVEVTLTQRIYHASAALLDLENPGKLLSRLKEPLFSPTEIWEKKGVIENVVFPTGAIVKGDDLYIYYGAADNCIGLKIVSISELLSELKKSEI